MSKKSFIMRTYDGPTGQLFEWEIFGTDATKVFTKQDPKDVKYLSWKKAMEEVISVYGKEESWDPCNPSTPNSKRLHRLVDGGLDDDAGDLELYPALNSSFDIHHGVDGFFKLGNKIVTIDLTTRDDKDNVKADFLITQKHFENPKLLSLLAECITCELTT